MQLIFNLKIQSVFSQYLHTQTIEYIEYKDFHWMIDIFLEIIYFVLAADMIMPLECIQNKPYHRVTFLPYSI